jgi:hypothetical protein
MVRITRPMAWTQSMVNKLRRMADAGVTREEAAARVGMTGAGLDRELKRRNGLTWEKLSAEREHAAKADLKVTLLEMALSKRCPAATLWFAKRLLNFGVEEQAENPLRDMSEEELRAQIAKIEGRRGGSGG